MEPLLNDEHRNHERSLGALFRQLSHDIGTLVRQEVELARVDVGTRAGRMAGAAALLGVGALLCFAGLLYLLLAAVYALAQAVDSAPIAAAIVGGGVSAIGAALLLLGRQRLDARELKPTHTIESLRKDAQLVRDPGSFSPDGRH